MSYFIHMMCLYLYGNMHNKVYEYYTKCTKSKSVIDKFIANMIYSKYKKGMTSYVKLSKNQADLDNWKAGGYV